jgi:putative flippase GtrA
VRFTVSGGVVTIVYLGTTMLLSAVVGVPFQVALAVGFSSALAVHFTLQRMFVWASSGEYALPLRRQAARYLAVALTQYGVTAASTAVLPGALGIPAEAVYLATVALLLGVNFLVFRHGIFHTKGPVEVGARSGGTGPSS